MSVDGIWTFVIPERQGGGVITVRNGRLFGGDVGYFFAGSYSLIADTVQGVFDVTRFNNHPALVSVWGDAAPQFRVTFKAKQSGDEIAGHLQRTGMPGQFGFSMTRRAAIP